MSEVRVRVGELDPGPAPVPASSTAPSLGPALPLRLSLAPPQSPMTAAAHGPSRIRLVGATGLKTPSSWPVGGLGLIRRDFNRNAWCKLLHTKLRLVFSEFPGWPGDGDFSPNKNEKCFLSRIPPTTQKVDASLHGKIFGFCAYHRIEHTLVYPNCGRHS